MYVIDRPTRASNDTTIIHCISIAESVLCLEDAQYLSIAYLAFATYRLASFRRLNACPLNSHFTALYRFWLVSSAVMQSLQSTANLALETWGPQPPAGTIYSCSLNIRSLLLIELKYQWLAFCWPLNSGVLMILIMVLVIRRAELDAPEFSFWWFSMFFWAAWCMHLQMMFSILKLNSTCPVVH